MCDHDLLSELQLLTSMYDPSQYHFDDVEVALKLENGVPISGSVSLVLKPNDFLQLSLRLPDGYPKKEKLSASCQLTHKGLLLGSSASMVNTQQQSDKIQSRLNNDLSMWLKYAGESSNEDDKSVLGVVNWVNEKWEEILAEEIGNPDLNDDQNTQIAKQDDNKTCRLWIHSHHIYNEKKRKFILDTATKLDLRGFSLPGKPGFICVEGDVENCDDFWTQVRQLTWQKITLIEKEVLEEGDNNAAFSTFEELRLDMTGFFNFLTEKNVSSVIKGYLGFG